MKKKLFTLIVASLFAFAGGGCTKNTNDIVEKYLTEKYNDSFTFDSYGNNSILYDKEIQQDLQKGTNSENKVFADTSLLYFGLNEKFNNYNA